MRLNLTGALSLLSLLLTVPACNGESEENGCADGDDLDGDDADGDDADGDEASCGEDGDETPAADPVACSEYCSTYAANCAAELFSFVDQADCEAQCATYAQGEPGVEEVDTLECRWVHAQEANDDEHCDEAAFDSTGCPG